MVEMVTITKYKVTDSFIAYSRKFAGNALLLMKRPYNLAPSQMTYKYNCDVDHLVFRGPN